MKLSISFLIAVGFLSAQSARPIDLAYTLAESSAAITHFCTEHLTDYKECASTTLNYQLETADIAEGFAETIKRGTISRADLDALIARLESESGRNELKATTLADDLALIKNTATAVAAFRQSLLTIMPGVFPPITMADRETCAKIYLVLSRDMFMYKKAFKAKKEPR